MAGRATACGSHRSTGPVVEKRQIFMFLSCGTSLERIAPESLTRHLFEFVHGDIWRHLSKWPQDRVDGQIRCLRAAKNPSRLSGRARHCERIPLADARWDGTETNWVACRTPVPNGVGTEAR
jgi:hypothetical protein